MTTKNIHEANLASVKELSETSAEFVIKPLYYGYGNTLGNSLRRVLLSSIKGAAITAFSIEGATHEYTTIPGIREDIVDIMLNLKNIRFKMHTDAPVELTLEMKGDKQTEKDGDKRVIAGDIKLPANVEIANTNQTICHIDDPKKTIKMHFVVETGRGYLTIEQASEDRIHSDMIAVDAVFTPVLRVRYKVENTRVGQDTNLQQLTMTVDTDGTITPREAFEEAAAILVNQYTALAGATKVESAPAPGSRKDDDDSGLMLPIEELDLSARTANALLNNDIRTIRDLVTLNEADLKDLKGFGQKALDEVKEKFITLAKKGGLANRRLIIARLNDQEVTALLVDVIAPQIKRDSGYLRIEHAGFRRGDNAEMGTISFVDDINFEQPAEKPAQKADKKPATKPAAKKEDK